MGDLQAAIAAGKKRDKQALFFGADPIGHYLYRAGSRLTVRARDFPDLPWDECLMDGGLLKNGKRPDVPDGKVYCEFIPFRQVGNAL